MRSKKYYLLLILFCKGQRKDCMKLNFLTYFCSRCCKRSHVKVPNYFFHSNALLCCVLLVHVDQLAFELYFSCPRAVVSSRSPSMVLTPWWTILNYAYISNSDYFISIHRLRMKQETELFPVILRYWFHF